MVTLGSSRVALGGQGSLRWRGTFIDVEWDCREEPVDPRVFRTEPGFRLRHGQEEYTNAFGDEIAYVEGLMGKLSSPWPAAAELAGEGNLDHDSASSRSVDSAAVGEAGAKSVSDHEHAPLGSLVISEGLPSMPEVPIASTSTIAPAQRPKGMSWQELRQRIRNKTKEISQKHPRTLVAVEESQDRFRDPMEQNPSGLVANAQSEMLEMASPPVALGHIGSQLAPVQPALHAMEGALPQGKMIENVAANHVVVQMVLESKISAQDSAAVFSNGMSPLAARAPLAAPALPTTQVPPASTTLRNPGSIGHPNLCLRPCLYFAAGQCSNGDSCQYCHLPHPKRPVHLDKRHREMLREMPLQQCAELGLPVLRQMVEKLDSPPEALATVDALARTCGLSVPDYSSMCESRLADRQRHHRMIFNTCKAMGMQQLAGTMRRVLSQHQPELGDAIDRLVQCMREEASAVGPGPMV